MKNFEHDPSVIEKAKQAGLISEGDFQKWQGTQGYHAALKKSAEYEEISKSIFDEELSKINGVHWQRDPSSPFNLRFKLFGVFQPLDLKKQSEGLNLLKSNNDQPIKKSIVDVPKSSIAKIQALAEKVMSSTASIRTTLEKSVANNKLLISKSKESSELQNLRGSGNNLDKAIQVATRLLYKESARKK